MIEVLWQVGFLLADMGTGKRSAGIQSFLGHHQVSHLNLRAARGFKIHPMFWGYLDLV